MASYSQAQFKKGDIEISFSGSAGSWKTSETFSGRTSSDSHSYIFMTCAPGLYIVDGVSIEAEIGLLAFEGMKPAQFLLGNISYTYLLSGSKLAPYARIGYGVSNSVPMPMFNGAPSRTSDGFKVGTLNAGCGVKFLVSKGAAARAEFNYKRSNWTNDLGSSSSADNTNSNLGLLLGFSILV
jgi:hypothetical protein